MKLQKFFSQKIKHTQINTMNEHVFRLTRKNRDVVQVSCNLDTKTNINVHIQ